MKTELDITRIMDDYTDNEFGIEGELAVDEEKAVRELLAQVKPEKKKVKPLFKVLVAAAAAAAVLAVGIAAADIVIKGGYTTSTGIGVSYDFGESHGSWSVSYENREAALRVEEGNRLMFVADGQNIDITDLVDENTPYIYSYENSEGTTCYTIAGGAAGDYGYIDLIPIPMSEDYMGWHENGYNTRTPKDQWLEYPEDVTIYGDDEKAEEKLEAYRKAADEARRSWFKPWCLAAFDELGVWGSINGYGENVAPDRIAEFNESIGYVFPGE